MGIRACHGLGLPLGRGLRVRPQPSRRASCPTAAASERRQQVDARALLWQRATKSYKDTQVRKRKRPDRESDSERVFEGRWGGHRPWRRNATDAPF